jgi:hypothetical protein
MVLLLGLIFSLQKSNSNPLCAISRAICCALDDRISIPTTNSGIYLIISRVGTTRKHTEPVTQPMSRDHVQDVQTESITIWQVL